MTPNKDITRGVGVPVSCGLSGDFPGLEGNLSTSVGYIMLGAGVVYQV